MNEFEKLLHENLIPLQRYVNFKIANKHDAEDVIQDVCLSATLKFDTLSNPTAFKAWLIGIAKHKCLNVLRKKIAEQKYSDSLTARETMANYSALSDETFDTVQMQELEQLIGQALSELPEKTRIIYKMSRDQEMTYEEIAQEIDLSVKSVEYHMTKALAHMRHKLKDYLILLCFGLIPLLT